MTRTLPPVHLRPAVAADVPACVDCYYRASEALLQARGETPWPRNPPALARLFEHLVTSDPECAVVAVSGAVPGDGELVGFALAHRRADRWLLGFLFVLPDWQGGGLGRALVEATLPDDHARWRLGVCVEAVQPVATGLYASLGMVPRLPLYLLLGTLRTGALRERPDLLVATPFAALDPAPGEPGTGSPLGPNALAAVGRLDRALLGGERPADHRLLRASGRLGLVFHRPGTPPNEAIGYGYVQPVGRIGPVLMTEPSLLEPALAELTTAVTPSDGWQVTVPGVAAHALGPLLAGGLRIDGGPAIYAADWDGPPFDRYLPMNSAIL